jgi:hypothetical protein
MNEVYNKLSSINVNHLVKEKNGFRYLPWASALDILLKHFPSSSWEHREWDEVPYSQSKAGCFVEVSVTVEGITRKQLHPILDYRNKPIPSPNCFEVNASIQRALAKAVALHGLGLYLFQGEDLPPSEKEAIADAREELKELLKQHTDFTPQIQQGLYKLNYTQLKEKIAEYRGKGE